MNDIHNDDDLGPIDYIVVEFPPGTNQFTGELAREIASLVDAEIIRVLDLMILQKDAAGDIEVVEFEDLADLGELGRLEGELADVLAADDVVHLAAAMENGSTAGVLVWENRWAAPFGVAARKMGGQLIASGRIPTQALIASMETQPMNEGD